MNIHISIKFPTHSTDGDGNFHLLGICSSMNFKFIKYKVSYEPINQSFGRRELALPLALFVTKTTPFPSLAGTTPTVLG